MTPRPTILVGLGCFTPSLRANGPNRTFARIVAALSDRFRFRLISLADPDEEAEHWHEFDGCERLALRPGRPFAHHLRRILHQTPHDLIVCNGFFDPALTLQTLLLRRAGAVRSPVLVAPRGEFSPGALQIKSIRKQLYLRALRNLGLTNGIVMQATDDGEASLIRAALPGLTVLVGPNIRPLELLPPRDSSSDDDVGLHIAFLSRVDRKKNLDWGLRMLAAADITVSFDIYGPTADQRYWQECQALIARMPPNISVSYCGSLAPELVSETLSRYDLMFLPTRGENFGHAIADSLLAGTPILISDTTPWRGLRERLAGADLALSAPGDWIDFLRYFADLSGAERRQWRAGARLFAERQLDPAADTERLAACFNDAIAGSTLSSASPSRKQALTDVRN